MPSQGEKQQVAVRIPLRQKADLEAEAVERGVSRSEYIRSILCERHRVNELEQRLEIREERIDELEQQLARRSQLEEKIENLPAQVTETESYRDRKERLLDEASVVQRMKWKVTGVPVEMVEPEDEDRPRR